MSGYCAIGSVESAMTPTSVMTILITPAKMGRSMKKCGKFIPMRKSECGIGSAVPTRGFDGGDGNRNDLIGFLFDSRKLRDRDEVRFFEQLEPEQSFVSFFFHDAHLGDEVRCRSCAARSAVVCRDRCA